MKYFIYTMMGVLVFSVFATVWWLRDKGENDRPQHMVSRRIGDIEVKLQVSPRTATPGDTVWFVLSVINRGNQKATVNLPTPEPARFTVYRNNRPVWVSDYGMMFAQVITPFSIEPGDSIPLKSFWLGRDNQAQLLPLGKYVVEGCFLGTKTCLKDTVWLVD